MLNNIRPEFHAATYEAIAGIRARMRQTGLSGASAQVDVIANGAGYDTLGGTYKLTSRDWHGRRNPTRTYDTLAAALVAYGALSAGGKRIWHVTVTGRRELVTL